MVGLRENFGSKPWVGACKQVRFAFAFRSYNEARSPAIREPKSIPSTAAQEIEDFAFAVQPTRESRANQILCGVAGTFAALLLRMFLNRRFSIPNH
jgi:hypothetical protein